MRGCKQCPAYAKCTVAYRGSACAALRWSYGIDTDPEIVNTTDREKLCELIKDGRMCPVDGNPFEEEKCMQCKYREDRDCDITRLADYLIANSVTVQKWKSAKTPPKDWKGEGGYLTNYYVYTPDYGVDIGNYMGAANRWLCMGMSCNVTHWMPLPEAPMEE